MELIPYFGGEVPRCHVQYTGSRDGNQPNIPALQLLGLCPDRLPEKPLRPVALDGIADTLARDEPEQRPRPFIAWTVEENRALTFDLAAVAINLSELPGPT